MVRALIALSSGPGLGGPGVLGRPLVEALAALAVALVEALAAASALLPLVKSRQRIPACAGPSRADSSR
jgi:hypothetical protein